ncbi:MAG: aldo/keto reductase [Chloroflexota bacterium]
MDYRTLGRTGLRVSRLCLGTLTMGPSQANLPLREGADLIRAALDLGVNFFDTADLYNTYDYLREGLRGWPGEVIISSKSFDHTREGMAASLARALRETGRERIDIFMLHEQESGLTIRGHWPAVEYLLEAKQRGLVGAVGVSTHAVAAVRAMTVIDELEVLHPLINQAGIGILDGSRDDMLAAIADAHAVGKGVFGMKAIGGGHLTGDAAQALVWAAGQPCLDAIAVGCRSAAELAVDAAVICGETPAAEAVAAAANGPAKRLRVEEWCHGCGKCVERCPQGALRIERERAVVDPERCILCSYCVPACRDFFIKVF